MNFLFISGLKPQFFAKPITMTTRQPFYQTTLLFSVVWALLLSVILQVQALDKNDAGEYILQWPKSKQFFSKIKLWECWNVCFVTQNLSKLQFSYIEIGQNHDLPIFGSTKFHQNCNFRRSQFVKIAVLVLSNRPKSKFGHFWK